MHRTIRFSDSFDGFRYHIGKSQLKAGSHISKNIHPVYEVELLKKKLINKRVLVDKGDYYVLKKTIQTSLIMARNLNLGEIINTQSPDWGKDRCYSLPKDEFLEDIRLGDLTSYGSAKSRTLFLDSQKITELCGIKIDFSDISDRDPNKFSNLEQLFLDELSKRGLISQTSRHGLSSQKECDIVDEKNRVQIEVTAVFKDRIIPNQAPQEDYASITLECIDNIFVSAPESLMKKYYGKPYTSRFKKQLAIYCLGNRLSVIRLATQICKAIAERGSTKNHFEKIYIIWNDFIEDKNYLLYFDNNSDMKIEEITTSVSLLRRLAPVSYTSIDTTDTKSFYYLRTDSVFDDNTLKAMAIMNAKDITNLVNTLHVSTNCN